MGVDMSQLSLELSPASRRTDNAASKRAEARQNQGPRNGDAAKVLKAFVAHPGCTTKELAALTGLDRVMCARRAPDLLDNGYLSRIDGPDGWRWYPTDKGKAA